MTSNDAQITTNVRRNRAPIAAAAAAGAAAFVLGVAPAHADTTAADPTAAPTSTPAATAPTFDLLSLLQAAAPAGVPTAVPATVPSEIPASFGSLFPAGIPTSIPASLPTSVPSQLAGLSSLLPNGIFNSKPSNDPSTQYGYSWMPKVTPVSAPKPTNLDAVCAGPLPANGVGQLNAKDLATVCRILAKSKELQAGGMAPSSSTSSQTDAPASASASKLANTGPGDVERLMGLAALLLAGGAGAVRASRKQFSIAGVGAVKNPKADVPSVEDTTMNLVAAPVRPLAVRPAVPTAAVGTAARHSGRRTRPGMTARPSIAATRSTGVVHAHGRRQSPAAS
jgi:hypothetical protein